MTTRCDEVNCNSTEQIVNQKILIYNILSYNKCASIQTANIFLSKTAVELHRILNVVYTARMNNDGGHSSEASEMIISDHDEVNEWCILP